MSQAFLAEIQGSLATVTFCRPEKHNALEISDLEALDSALINLAGRSDIRTLLLCAQGKSFCAGVDFGAVAGHDWRDNPLERVSDRLESLPFPTLCVLQGGVYGGNELLGQAAVRHQNDADHRSLSSAGRPGVLAQVTLACLS